MFHVSIHGSLDRYFNQPMLPPESCCCNWFPFSGCVALRRLLDDRVLLQALDWERWHDSSPFVVRTELPAKRDFPRSAVRHLHNWNSSFYCKQNILWITKIFRYYCLWFGGMPGFYIPIVTFELTTLYLLSYLNSNNWPDARNNKLLVCKPGYFFNNQLLNSYQQLCTNTTSTLC